MGQRDGLAEKLLKKAEANSYKPGIVDTFNSLALLTTYGASGS